MSDPEESIPAPETWKRANLLISQIDRWLIQYTHGTKLRWPTSIISVGDDHGVDLQWRGTFRNILVSVPADPLQPPHFAAHDRSNPLRDIEGTLSTDDGADNTFLFAWFYAGGYNDVP